jgi:hypothetical protein
MKVYAINRSPRKNKNTATLLLINMILVVARVLHSLAVPIIRRCY